MENALQMNAPENNNRNAARQRKRSIAIALVLCALVVLFYVITIVHMGPGILDRPL